MNDTQARPLIDGTVAAEDAPLGVLLWPVRSPEYARNFTLVSVTLTREPDRSYVVWTYQSGKTRLFVAGAQVVVRIDPGMWPTRDILAFNADPVLEISTHHADGVATRPTSTLRSHVVGHQN